MAGLNGFQERMSALSLSEVAACLMADKPLPFLVDLFDYLRSEGAFLHAVMGPGGDIRFAPRLRDSVCTCLVHVYPARALPHGPHAVRRLLRSFLCVRLSGNHLPLD